MDELDEKDKEFLRKLFEQNDMDCDETNKEYYMKESGHGRFFRNVHWSDIAPILYIILFIASISVSVIIYQTPTMQNSRIISQLYNDAMKSGFLIAAPDGKRSNEIFITIDDHARAVKFYNSLPNTNYYGPIEIAHDPEKFKFMNLILYRNGTYRAYMQYETSSSEIYEELIQREKPPRRKGGFLKRGQTTSGETGYLSIKRYSSRV